MSGVEKIAAIMAEENLRGLAYIIDVDEPTLITRKGMSVADFAQLSLDVMRGINAAITEAYGADGIKEYLRIGEEKIDALAAKTVNSYGVILQGV